jgi:hypothetical protein
MATPAVNHDCPPSLVLVIFGSQRCQISLGPARSLQVVSAGERLSARLLQTSPDSGFVSGGQGVAGSNPAVPTQRTSPLITANVEVSGHIRVYRVHLQLPFTRRSWGPSGDHLALRWALSAVPASVMDWASGCR